MSKVNTNTESYPPKVRRDYGISPLWIVPLVTLILAGWLVIKAVHEAGQSVQIYFSDAEGLVAGRTTIRYQGLEVGMVRNITLSRKLDNIYVDADIYPEATPLLGKHTRFWLVKPTASISGISGLDALVSGNYIAIQPGEPDDDDEIKDTYTALDGAPADLQASQGLNITLESDNLASISIGSQILYRKIPIGEVYSYQLSEDSRQVLIKAFIKNEFRHIITSESRFWNVSGVAANIGFKGIDVRMASLSALLAGAIAVDAPDAGDPVQEYTHFKLYPDLQTAGRGIPISITLPDNNKITPNGTPIMYRGIEVGQITDLSLGDERKSVIASAAIQPAFSDLLTTGSRFLLEEAKLSLTELDNISNLITGNYLTLVPGTGNKTREFSAVRKDDLLREQESSLPVTLLADNSYGLNAGSSVLYKGLSVGSVSSVSLKNDRIQIKLLIDKQYKHLLKSDNRFFVTGSATAELTESGLNISVPPAKQLLTGSVSFVSEGKPAPNTEYHLYASQSLAELAAYNQGGSTVLHLFAQELPPVNDGSPLLYRNLSVGHVSGYHLTKEGVALELQIENRYRHLIQPDTVFWNRSGVEIEASLSGINIQAAPLKSLIQGGIAFDSIPGVENKKDTRWLLYPDLKHARRYGKVITLLTTQNVSIGNGTPIRYQGVTIGEVTSLIPDFKHSETHIKVQIMPEYVSHIALENSYFQLITAEVGIKGIKNLDTLLNSYIDVKPGSGHAQFTFPLNFIPKQEQGVHFTLQSETRDSLETGTPVFYREMEVGKVNSVELGTFADRIITTIEIEKRYAYLVRENTVFWNVSGVDVSVGLSGAHIKSGTVDSLLRGGVAFATPENTTLSPVAENEQSFFLHPEAKEEWLQWRTPIPKPE
ncbi:paraquat-inducible protein B [Vibrio sp. HA2012]|uniref:PqiB family protein n=1 Tax=Vibrio sp. HA2012 TaxID=1971595 RepID=UPI000C2B7942|nr:MlaD family protein [Vibrio sp. HA2012]PJC87961.1 paraquat-inducible protein B [Vibrio sp. HA2012]